MSRKSWLVVTMVAAFVASSLVGPGAGAHSGKADPPQTRKDAVKEAKQEFYRQHHQHGPASGHLPPVSENVGFIGKKRLTNRADKISDVAVLGDYAYLGEWAGGLITPACRGGVHVADISNPASPQKVNFLPSHAGTYATEGVQALSVADTGFFNGDLLVVSNESCTNRGIGGITLWDVSDPLNAVKLSEDGGDYTNGDENSTNLDPVAHDSHSAMAWQEADGDLYLIAIDNEEGLDVDFFDITDPRNPVLLSETGLEEWPSVVVDAFGNFPTAHDFDVRFIGGQWLAMISYWDAGWVLLNVDDPANPVLIGDFNYPECDAYAGVEDVDPRSCPPEGNAHQGEWNEAGNQFIGTDEDSSSFRLLPIEVTEQTTGTGTASPQPAVGTQYEGGEFGWTVPVATLSPDGVLNGPVAYGGYGCDESAAIPDASVLDPFMSGDPNEERIVVLQRGPVSDPGDPYEACFFSIKIENAQDAGYDAAIIANHHVGSAFGQEPDAFFCGGQGHVFTITARGLCSGHRSLHEMFGSPPNYGTDSNNPGYPEADLNSSIGLVGPKIETSSFFDGFGYSWLFDATPPFTIRDTVAMAEQLQIENATGKGDLTVHEVATGRGPDADLAYYSWYSGGFRVARFDADSIDEVAKFIDQGGNDLWGVQLTDKFVGGRRVVALSDRDYGLYLLTYTGP
jgi:hypothetical protein